MKRMKMMVYATLFVVGLGIGLMSTSDVSGNTPCGRCAFEPSIGMYFCNFTFTHYTECGGNNGASCGQVPCSPVQSEN
jgi:hypothetical protein